MSLLQVHIHWGSPSRALKNPLKHMSIYCQGIMHDEAERTEEAYGDKNKGDITCDDIKDFNFGPARPMEIFPL
jgi:hypothetical protein